MSVRLKITLLFTLLVALILTIVMGTVYYFSYTLRLQTIHTKLTNRAITIGRLLSQTDIFSNQLIQKIDSSTSLGYTSETILAYDYKNKKVYDCSDSRARLEPVSSKLLRDARIEGNVYFNLGTNDAIAYHYVDNDSRLVMIAAGEDITGKQNLSRLTNILLLSYLGGLLIACVGGYIFSKQLLRPIRLIADTVNLVSAQNLSQRIKTSVAKDEWNYLSTTVNNLLNRLQDSFDVQRRFISNASHELSTPLTSISNQLEVSLQREREAHDYKKVMESVHHDVIHMSHLIRALLAFAKAAGQPGGIEISPIRIDEILFRLPAAMVKENPKFSVRFAFDELPEKEELLMIFGNDELLFVSFKNLVSNACKYSVDNKAVIKLSAGGGEVVICIVDNGIGISASEIDKIFQPFHRVDETAREGFGLGLSLASRIIKLHKGSIQVTSVLNEGSTFTVSLPVAAP